MKIVTSARDPSTPGIVSEVAEIQRTAPPDPQNLGPYAAAYNADLQDASPSGPHDRPLSALFPPYTHSWSYTPLRLADTLLKTPTERAARTTLIRSLLGTSHLCRMPKFHRTCPHCPQIIRSLDHYLFRCPSNQQLRSQLFTKAQSHCATHFPDLVPFAKPSDETNFKNILLGATDTDGRSVFRTRPTDPTGPTS